MDYPEAWAFLDRLQFFKIKLGLESMSRFLDSLDRPQDRLLFVHVAGTNGKGSVASALVSVLSEAGYRVGLYTSPHLSSVRERFRIGDRFISEAAFAQQASRIAEALAGEQITYFEFTTALALLWFAAEQVDLAVLEVGMGGRLDATNVVRPLISIITNVAMDHEQYLGDTPAAIAREKAGIIKPGVPVVTGVAADDSLAVIEDVCRKQGSRLLLLGRDFTVNPLPDQGVDYQGPDGGRCLKGLQLGLIGRHQIDNAALSLASLDLLAKDFLVPEDAIRRGLCNLRWPGRLETFSAALTDGEPRRYLLDGAHNPAGAESLRRALVEGFPRHRLILVWAGMADKDLAGTLSLIVPLAHRIIFTRPESERSADFAQFAAILPPTARAMAVSTNDVAEALARAAEEATADDLICVAGSLYLVGAARRLLLGELI